MPFPRKSMSSGGRLAPNVIHVWLPEMIALCVGEGFRVPGIVQGRVVMASNLT